MVEGVNSVMSSVPESAPSRTNMKQQQMNVTTNRPCSCDGKGDRKFGKPSVCNSNAG
jgi:hypothetical protein